MIRWMTRLILLCGMLQITPAWAQAPADPTKVVANLQAGLIKLMQEGPKLDFAGRFQQLVPLVKETHQLKTSARIALGTNWPKLTEEQRTRFVDTFTTLSIATYAANFVKFSGESFKVQSTQPTERGQMLVRAILTRPGESDVHFDYVLEQTDGKWKIVNIVVDGVSDLALKRSEYSAVIQKEGFDALLGKLNQKIEKFRETAKK